MIWKFEVKAPNEPQYIEIEWEQGRAVGLGGEKMDGVPLLEKLNQIGGKHGVGRIDHVENRLVGIKSREIYEAPAAVVLHKAHQALEDLCLMKEQARFKARVALEYVRRHGDHVRSMVLDGAAMILFIASLQVLKNRPRLSLASITDRTPGSESL